MNLNSLGVSIIGLSETNLHWKRNHLTQKFKYTLNKTWSKDKISICTSESDLLFTTYLKPGGTTLATLNPISPSIISKRQDHRGLGSWTYITILGKELQQTILFNVYRPCKVLIDSAGCTTVVKQQWLLIQRDNRHQHFHHATIQDLIEEIKVKQRESHNIIITIDGNESFVSSKGGISNLCRECKLYDIYIHYFKNKEIPRTYSKRSNMIDYILYSFNILTSLTQCGMTTFGELVSSDHRGLYIDIPTTSIIKHTTDEMPSSFQRTLKSSCPKSVRVYKRHLEKK